MPALLTQGSIVMCAHGGQAQPTVLVPRVQATGQSVVAQPGPWTIAGCAFPPPPAGNGPCVTAIFTAGTTRVTALGMPLLTQVGMAQCIPTGTPALVSMTQQRVQGI